MDVLKTIERVNKRLARTYQVFNAICSEGLDNSHWGVAEDVDNTRRYFGTNEILEIKGQFVYVYRPIGETYGFFKGITPDYTLTDNYRQYLDIYLM